MTLQGSISRIVIHNFVSTKSDLISIKEETISTFSPEFEIQGFIISAKIFVLYYDQVLDNRSICNKLKSRQSVLLLLGGNCSECIACIFKGYRGLEFGFRIRILC